MGWLFGWLVGRLDGWMLAVAVVVAAGVSGV